MIALHAVVVVVAVAIDLPVLGNGLSFRTSFLSQIFQNRDKIDFLEIITDHYMFCSSKKWEELCMLKENFVLIPHSLDLSLGSADGLDIKYLEELSRVLNFIDPPWISDHLAFTKSSGINIGHLAPVPFTEESLSVFDKNISIAKKYISKPMVLENITSMLSLPGEMNEADFLTELFSRCDVSWLMDVTNLFVNAKNFNIELTLEHYPLEKAVQVHYTGFSKRNDWLIDSHISLTQEPVMTLLEAILGKCNIKATVLERDDPNPPFNELLKDLNKVRGFSR